jgi:hypothetical protein
MEEQQPADAGAMVRAIPVEEIARILALNPIFAQFDRSALLAVAAHLRRDPSASRTDPHVNARA